MAVSLRALDRPCSLSDQTYAALRDQLRSRPVFERACVARGEPRGATRRVAHARAQALQRLACEGLLEPSGRSFVRPALSRADVDEINELRLLLEPEAARQVAATVARTRLAQADP